MLTTTIEFMMYGCKYRKECLLGLIGQYKTVEHQAKNNIGIISKIHIHLTIV
jgi:hypothetical protein